MTNKEKYRDPEKLLNSLDGIRKAEAPPFFYGKLISRMQQGIPDAPVKRPFALRPVLATVMLSAFLLVNIFMLVQQKKTVQDKPEQPATIESFANAYGLGTSSVY